MRRLVGRVALITGAGSGIGRAIALALAAEGASLVLAGRTEAALQATAALVREQAGDAAAQVSVVSGDVARAEEVRQIVEHARTQFGRIDILVNNAGMNVPRRALDQVSLDDWEKITAINLDGAFLCTHAVLPIMRAQGAGTLIHIGSNAVRRPGRLAGAAYTAAKAGVTALSAVINAEEQAHGIRSSVITVGDTNTPLLDQRPQPPDAAARAASLQPDDVAACALLIATLPARAAIEEITVMPTALA